jgi:hypothetical protein
LKPGGGGMATCVPVVQLYRSQHSDTTQRGPLVGDTQMSANAQQHREV